MTTLEHLHRIGNYTVIIAAHDHDVAAHLCLWNAGYSQYLVTMAVRPSQKHGSPDVCSMHPPYKTICSTCRNPGLL